MSAPTQTIPTRDEVLAVLAGDDNGEVRTNDATPDGASTAQDEKPDTETDETEKGQSSDEVESPEAGTEPEEKAEESAETKGEGTEKTEKEQGEQKPLTKAEKDAARAAKAWRDIEAKKAEIAREREEVERAKAEIALAKAQKPEPVKDEKGYSADDYEAFADLAEKNIREAEENDIKPAYTMTAVLAARKRALELRHRETVEGESKRAAAVQAEFQKVTKDYPDLNKSDSPLAKAVHEIWEKNKEFYNRPGSLEKMAELASLRVKAGSVPALEKKINELASEVKRLTQLTSPSKGGQGYNGGKKASAGTPTEEEVIAALRRDDLSRGY